MAAGMALALKDAASPTGLLSPEPSRIGAAAPSAPASPPKPGDELSEKKQKSRIQDIINRSLQTNTGATKHSADPLVNIAFSADEEVVINRGRFSWFSAVMMCVFVITGFASLILMMLSLRNTSVTMISEEISYIDAQNPPWDVPPWGYVKQPNDAPSRKIGKPFRYAMPVFMLFYAIFCASFGLFTTAYFCSELLVQDMGVNRVKNLGEVINKGVDVYLFRAVPITIILMSTISSIVYFVSDLNFTIAMVCGGATCLCCTNMGINMNFEGGTRLTHALNYDLGGSINFAIRSGAIGGLSAHSLALLGMVTVWMVDQKANSLLGFAAGTSIIAFYMRIAGGIFAKGCDIGSDFVSTLLGEDVDDYNMDSMDELRRAHNLHDLDMDGEEDEAFEERQHIVDPNAYIDEADMGFITKQEAQLRAKIEVEMENMLKTMHPVNYLDAIGENIADIGGTSSDLFETMCLTLATAVILGGKAHEVPYFGTALPFNIIASGTLGCSVVSYYVWCHEKHTSNRIRRSLQLNLLCVMIFVQASVVFACYLQWQVYHLINYDTFWNYCMITLLGLCAPEACAAICEYFTSVNYAPVSWIAKDAHLGMIQVVLRGLGQGFASAGLPSVVNLIVQILAFQWEGFYGLVLLTCASQACTGWQATLAAFGAAVNNANRYVHLTTVNEMAHHRANVCASIGTTTSHNGKCIAGQNAFFATTCLLGALMADKYTQAGENFKNTTGQEFSEFTRAGLLASIVFTMLFLANTLSACITMAKSVVSHCKDNSDVVPRKDKVFPATHIRPLANLVSFASIECFRLTISPMIQTFGAPLVIGQLFGFKGLLMMLSGGNSVAFSLNMFLINSGQAWDAARKYILFGMLKDEQGNVIGAESEVYDTLGIGEQIGGPLEDLCGPALNNFIKFVAVTSFVTRDVYDMSPAKSWPWGMVQIAVNFALVAFFKWGLTITIKYLEAALKKAKDRIEYEEGTAMLQELEARDRQIEERMQERGGPKKDDEEVQLF